MKVRIEAVCPRDPIEISYSSVQSTFTPCFSADLHMGPGSRDFFFFLSFFGTTVTVAGKS